MREELLGIFQKLPKESFELILRNMQIREKLKSLWEKYDRGDITSEDFEEIFDEIFILFFRPLEIMLKMGKSIKFLLSERMFTRIQENLLNAYLDFLNAWMEHIKTLSRIYSMEKADVVENFIDAWQDYLSRYMEVEYSEILRISEELPFLMPKEASEHLFKSMESWLSFEKSYQEYRDILFYIYKRSVHDFLDAAKKSKIKDFESFISKFADFVARDFDVVLKSDEYIRTQGEMLNSLMDYIYNARRFMELMFENSPLNPFATISQIDEAYKRITDLRRKINELEERIEKLERGKNV